MFPPSFGSALSVAGESRLPVDAPFDKTQRLFVDGLLAGLSAIVEAQEAGDTGTTGSALRVLFGSQTGTAEALSKNLRKFAATQGFDATISDLDAVTLVELAEVEHLLIIVATTGEGEPCDNAKRFHTALMNSDAQQLPPTLQFSVCGLGDLSYPAFNKIAKEVDVRLHELGATRIRDAVFCDTAYEDDFAVWKEDVFATPAFANAAGTPRAPEPFPDTAEPVFTKQRPFTATVLDVRRLSGQGPGKVVNHVEIALAGGGPDLDYRAGDALGLWPVNDPAEISAFLAAAGFTGAESVSLKSGPARLRSALLRFDLTLVTPATRKAWAVPDAPADGQVIDLLRHGVPGLTPQVLIDGLRPLQSRLYSISSSPEAHPGEVHLTVGELRYDLHGTERKGCASTFLGGRIAPGSTVGVFVQQASHFHPPEDDRPLIMIGPGTGIAPFRAFLEEREARNATGENWLFFGDRTEARDYLYRDQIEGWRATGLLARTSLAWSRDGQDKVYVQDMIRRDASEVFAWLERGAAIYICGDAARMAADVDRALHHIIADAGQMDARSAAAYVERLVHDHRYRRDVY
ncbi:sulfite reductase flavoprotein subunit alpha [Paracoccus sp. JM45]|uniref:diflavin oxidoreductase n=1 Tax=Paracoccus sp. JM45 TaxID=2283626 RepID=UPI000E6C4382|nr:flavodoxin domain-containing protein [Paracoccus sp. JM45]RJE78555.1 sulfite reductase subunit alpha [Paracoccus sp. JM45]